LINILNKHANKYSVKG